MITASDILTDPSPGPETPLHRVTDEDVAVAIRIEQSVPPVRLAPLMIISSTAVPLIPCLSILHLLSPWFIAGWLGLLVMANAPIFAKLDETAQSTGTKQSLATAHVPHGDLVNRTGHHHRYRVGHRLPAGQRDWSLGQNLERIESHEFALTVSYAQC